MPAGAQGDPQGGGGGDQEQQSAPGRLDTGSGPKCCGGQEPRSCHQQVAAAHGERVSDELYAQAAERFEAKALATMMFPIGQVDFSVAVARMAEPVPGRSSNDLRK
ncbi:hypothetical protein [Streptomyces alboflavus]|uniref:hypothetical protein n=1 Tax=Streptomyces alboflavus TaxID=67267 RepID=UPI00368E54B1